MDPGDRRGGGRDARRVVEHRDREDLAHPGHREREHVVPAEARIHARQCAEEPLLDLRVRRLEQRVVGRDVLRQVHQRVPADLRSIDERRHLDDRREGSVVEHVREVVGGERTA
jgi:hypothetical protein